MNQEKSLRQESSEHFSPRAQIGDQLLFGNSKQMKAIGEMIRRFSDADVPVLVTGESGTGKELIANAIHSRSLGKNGRFIKVNCANIPKDLLESELFGYERGAFTGAVHNKPGRFEFAHGGTIFLDEVGEITPLLQSKLLNFLQEGEFFRLGGKSRIKVDARVITASNRDVEEIVREGILREDLFYRLNVIRIRVPPLREREEEITRLARYFLQKYSLIYKQPIKRLSERALTLISEYSWPGNVRELENFIRKTVVLNNEETALRDLICYKRDSKTFSDYDLHDHAECSLREIGKKAALEAERKAIERILDQTCWNRTQAAKILQVSYKTLLSRIKEFELSNKI